jgi:hypothetical protein
VAKHTSVFRHPLVVAAGALTLLGAVFAFAVIGMTVAGESPAFGRAAWVPRLLAAASGFLVAAFVLRRLRGLFK